MARPREFDPDQVIERAMNVFWTKGYEGASLQDLLRAMGIARGSLYKAFKNKHGVYLAALDHYDRTVVEQGLGKICDPGEGDGAVRVRRLLQRAIDPVALRHDRRGCLFCNAAVERAPTDPMVQAKVLFMLKRLEHAIGLALGESKSAGRWDRGRRAATARLIANAYFGLRVLAKAGYPPAELEAIAEANLRQAGIRASAGAMG